MQILVFKTNISDESHIGHVDSFLRTHPGISTWNVDLKDCDKILRVEATGLHGSEIKNMLGSAGYFCEELL